MASFTTDARTPFPTFLESSSLSTSDRLESRVQQPGQFPTGYTRMSSDPFEYANTGGDRFESQTNNSASELYQSGYNSALSSDTADLSSASKQPEHPQGSKSAQLPPGLTRLSADTSDFASASEHLESKGPSNSGGILPSGFTRLSADSAEFSITGDRSTGLDPISSGLRGPPKPSSSPPQQQQFPPNDFMHLSSDSADFSLAAGEPPLRGYTRTSPPSSSPPSNPAENPSLAPEMGGRYRESLDPRLQSQFSEFSSRLSVDAFDPSSVGLAPRDHQQRDRQPPSQQYAYGALSGFSTDQYPIPSREGRQYQAAQFRDPSSAPSGIVSRDGLGGNGPYPAGFTRLPQGQQGVSSVSTDHIQMLQQQQQSGGSGPFPPGFTRLSAASVDGVEAIKGPGYPQPQLQPQHQQQAGPFPSGFTRLAPGSVRQNFPNNSAQQQQQPPSLSHLQQQHALAATPPSQPQAPKNDILFVGDLARYCKESDLKSMFEIALAFLGEGIVENVAIKKDGNGVNLGYGFVWLRDHACAQIAMELLDGKFLCGRPLRIRWGARKEQLVSQQMQDGNGMMMMHGGGQMQTHYGGGGAESGDRGGSVTGSSRPNNNSIYVRFSSVQLGVLVTESKILEVFRQLGDVVDISIRSSFFDKMTGLQHGFAFVHFPETADGIKTSKHVTSAYAAFQVDDITFLCEASKNLLKIMHQYPQFAGQTKGNKNGGKGAANNNNINNNKGKGMMGPPAQPPLTPQQLYQQHLQQQQQQAQHFGGKSPLEMLGRGTFSDDLLDDGMMGAMSGGANHFQQQYQQTKRLGQQHQPDNVHLAYNQQPPVPRHHQQQLQFLGPARHQQHQQQLLSSAPDYDYEYEYDQHLGSGDRHGSLPPSSAASKLSAYASSFGSQISYDRDDDGRDRDSRGRISPPNGSYAESYPSNAYGSRTSAGQGQPHLQAVGGQRPRSSYEGEPSLSYPPYGKFDRSQDDEN